MKIHPYFIPAIAVIAGILCFVIPGYLDYVLGAFLIVFGVAKFIRK